jgi:hypothetical protein
MHHRNVSKIDCISVDSTSQVFSAELLHLLLASVYNNAGYELPKSPSEADPITSISPSWYTRSAISFNLIRC